MVQDGGFAVGDSKKSRMISLETLLLALILSYSKPVFDGRIQNHVNRETPICDEFRCVGVSALPTSQ